MGISTQTGVNAYPQTRIRQDRQPPHKIPDLYAKMLSGNQFLCPFDFSFVMFDFMFHLDRVINVNRSGIIPRKGATIRKLLLFLFIPARKALKINDLQKHTSKN
jgi:hypothetical protein